MMKPISNARPILVISPQAPFRWLLADELKRAGCSLTLGVESLDEALEAAKRLAPSRIVVDCVALKTRWLDLLGELQEASPGSAIVVLGEEDDIAYEREVGQRSGYSYRSKLEPLPTVISALCPRE